MISMGKKIPFVLGKRGQDCLLACMKKEYLEMEAAF
jgi:hypothetical protein